MLCNTYDIKDNDGRTALMLACVRGHRDVVDLLLSGEADGGVWTALIDSICHTVSTYTALQLSCAAIA